jgi:hypothetical protein
MISTTTNGKADHMAKMRAAKAAKAKAKKHPEPAEAQKPPLRFVLPQQYGQFTQRSGVLDVQINTDPDMQNVTLTVKGPAPKMRALVRFAIEQSVPFLNDDAQ